MNVPLIFVQFGKYTLVGLLSNCILFLFYLLLTRCGLGPKLAMSILYVVGVVQTFLVNRRWTFQSVGKFRRAMVRYWFSYAFGYVLNLTVLFLCVDIIGWAHQPVQGVMIIFLALMLFCLQKLWVFKVE